REQVERLVRVQGRIREHLGTRVAEFESRYKALLDRDQARVRDLPQVIAAYRDLASTWVDAKRQQVQALNDAGFSLDEYRWVRQRTYAALGVPLLDVDVARLIESVQSGESPEALASSTDAAGGQERSDA